ncbi:RDD family protein [Halocola ammonii]
MDSEILDQNLSQQNKLSADELVLASKGKRFANLIIDYIIRFVIALILTFGMEMFGLYQLSYNPIFDILFSLVLVFLYYSLLEASLNGKSIGKFVTQTRAVNEDGSEIDFNTAMVRSISRLVPFEPFSYLGDSKSGWHDKWSNTVVIDETKSRQSELNGLE